MNIADITIAIVIVLSVLIGIVRGFIGEVMSIASWIAATVASFAFGGRVADLFGAAIDMPSARAALGYALVFIVVLLAGALVTWLLRKAVQGSGLSGTDRMLGLVFGLVRGALVVVVLVLLAGLTPFPRDAWWRESRALPAFERLATQVLAQLPESVSRRFDWRAEAPAPPDAKPAPAPRRGAALIHGT
jgi:membrane protein required for colicin V production